jgi:hypothetical protein
MLYYSIITNLLICLQHHEINKKESELEKLPEGTRNWIYSFILQLDDMPEDMFDNIKDYLENSLKKDTRFHKETTFQ